MRRDERGNIAVVLVCGGEVCPWGHAFFGWSFLIMLTFCEGCCCVSVEPLDHLN